MGTTSKRRSKISSTSATKPAQALAFAEELAGRVDNWIDFHNALFGIGGKLGELFPTETDRTQFSKTPEFARIKELLDQVRGVTGDGELAELLSSASGYLSVRLPRSLHAALLAEAQAEGVSLNQLCVTKLAMQLRALTAA